MWQSLIFYLYGTVFFFFILTNQCGNSHADIQKWQVSELQWGVYPTTKLGEGKDKGMEEMFVRQILQLLGRLNEKEEERREENGI